MEDKINQSNGRDPTKRMSRRLAYVGYVERMCEVRIGKGTWMVDDAGSGKGLGGPEWKLRGM